MCYLNRLYLAGRPRSQSSSYYCSSESVSDYKQKPSAHPFRLPKTANGEVAPATPTNPQRSRFQSPHLSIDLSLPVICPSPSGSHTAAATPASTSRANTHTHAHRAGRQWHSQHSHGRSTRHGTRLYFIMAAARHSTLDFMLSATGEPPHSGDSSFLAYPPTHGCLTGP